jgi:putative transposase
MARQPRGEFPGAYYHVMSRGNNKQDIFYNNSDRVRFLKTLEKAVAASRWECYAFCLMDNHYHLVVHTPESTLANGMKYLNGVYTQWFNSKYGRVGHLLQGRFYSKFIEQEAHLMAMVRYIVQNPIRSGISADITGWEWSSYAATSGAAPCPDFLDIDFFLGLFSDNMAAARSAYREYVCVPAKVEPWMKFEHSESEAEHPERLIALEDLFRSCSDADTRNKGIVAAYHDHGYSMTEIAKFLGITRSRVSQIVSESRGQSL